MKKKIISIIALCCLLTLSLFAVACGDPDPDDPKPEVPAHKMEYTPRDEPSCTTDGRERYWYCTECKKYFADAEGKTEIADLDSLVIPHPGHKYSAEWSFDSDDHWHAATCGHNEKKDAMPHDFKDGFCNTCKMQKGTEGLEIIYDVERGGCLVTGIGAVTDKNIVIPSSYEGNPVKIISDSAFKGTDIESVVIPSGVERIFYEAFSGCRSLTSVSIPDSVTLIGGSAFKGCRSLTEITVTASVAELGEYAFSECYALTVYCKTGCKTSSWNSRWNPEKCPVVSNCETNSVANDGYEYSVVDGKRYGFKSGAATLAGQPLIKSAAFDIPASVVYKGGTYRVTEIGEKAFIYYGSDKDTPVSVNIPDSVTAISNGAFYGCNIEEITIPNSVESIGEGAFTDSALKSIGIPDSVQTIAKGAFSTCTRLKTAKLPSGLTAVPQWMFAYCDALETVETTAEITSVGEYAFGGCKSLNDVGFLSSVTKIDKMAFASCDSINEINLSNVTEIGQGAFTECDSLYKATIGTKVTKVGYGVFYDCPALTVYCEAAQKPDGWDADWAKCDRIVWNCKNNNTATDGYIYEIIGGVRYKLKDGKAVVAVQPKTVSGVVTVQSSVAYGGVTYAVNELDENAFYNCDSMTLIKLPASIEKLGFYSIAYCEKLERIEFEGTQAQWAVVVKVNEWNGSGSDKTPVVCLGG